MNALLFWLKKIHKIIKFSRSLPPQRDFWTRKILFHAIGHASNYETQTFIKIRIFGPGEFPWCPNIFVTDCIHMCICGCTDTVGQTVKLTTWLCAHVCSPPVCTALRARVRFLLAELRLISFRLPWVSCTMAGSRTRSDQLAYYSLFTAAFFANLWRSTLFALATSCSRPTVVLLRKSVRRICFGSFRTIILAWFCSTLIDRSFLFRYVL